MASVSISFTRNATKCRYDLNTDYASESTDEGAEGFELERKNDEMELNLNSRGNTSFFKVRNF